METITTETDYPHSDSTWPHSKELLASQMGHLTQPEVDAICRDNAIRMLGLDLPTAAELRG